MKLTKSKTKFNSYGGIITNKTQPCTEEEVRLLENNLKCRFPEAYREFLLWMGHGAGTFLQGTDIFYEHVQRIQKWAKELLSENSFPKSLPDDAIVFMMHQGYQFMFFRISEGDNPPIYYYHEAYHFDSFELRFPNLDEFLLAQLDIEMG